MCDTCKDRGTCPFYEAGDDVCVDEALAKTAQVLAKREEEKRLKQQKGKG